MNGKTVGLNLIVFLISLSFVSAVDFTPQGDINLRGIYQIKNATNITAEYFCNATACYTIPELKAGTSYYAGGIYISLNGTNYFILNETKLNDTIQKVKVNNATYADSTGLWDGRSALSDYNIGNWTGDKGDYYTSVQTDTEIETANTAQNTTLKSWVLAKEYYNHVNNLTAVLNSVYVSFSNIVSIVGNFSAWDKAYEDLINKPSVLSNFTDNLGDRGYSHLSNFTNNLNIGNWTDDKSDYYTSTQTDTQIVTANTSVVDWVNAQEFYNNVANLTAVLDSIYVRISNIVSLVGNWSADKSSYYTSTETDTEIENANASMKSYTDNTFITQANEGNLNVNSSDYWDNLNTPSDINAGDITDDNTYVQVSGDTITGNLTVDEYINGQPIDGSIGSGVIWCDDIDSNANVNLTVSGLDITYPNMIVRLVTTTGETTYCNITSGTVTISNDKHYVFYVDGDCVVKNTTFSNYIDSALSPGGQTDIFDAFASGGVVGIYKGTTLKNKETIKTRKAMVRSAHLNVISGLNLNFDTTFPEIYQNTGEYMYLRSVVDTTAQNSTIDGIHQVGHSGGSWVHLSQTGINLSYCDNGTDLVTCPTNVFRRYIIYTIGRIDGTDTTTLHFLVPLTTDTTYANIANCLNVVESPVSYTLSSSETYTSVVTYAYCGKRDDSDWQDGWIDLRKGVTGVGAIPDTSNFLTKDTDFAGDISGTYDNIIVADDSHAHDCSNITGATSDLCTLIDTDTNLTEADITGFGFIKTDTNASTACSGGEVLYGNGTCSVPSLSESDPVWASNHTNMQVDCGAGLYSYGIYENGTLKCRVDSGTDYTAGTGLKLIGAEFSFNETYGDNRYITSESDPIFGAWDYSNLLNKSSDTYVVTESDPVYSAWNKFTGVDTIVASAGNWTADKSSYWDTSNDLDTVISADEISEGNIAFSTTCSAGNHYYLNGNDLACEADDDTTYSAGNGISLSTTTFSVAGNTALTQDADGLSVTANAIGNTQLEYDTGQHLTTTSDVTFAEGTFTGNATINGLHVDKINSSHHLLWS